MKTQMVMDHQTNTPESNLMGSFDRTSSLSHSQGRRSLSLSRTIPFETDDDSESESGSVSEAGDIGDRALHSQRSSERGSTRLSLGSVLENSSSLPEEMASLSIDATVRSKENKGEKTKVFTLLPLMDYTLCLLHLAFFGILGVLTRYLLQKLFGPGIAGLTSDHFLNYLDLPANMVGSFLMGWLGVVFKGNISRVSDHLAIGLTTGYLGSLTTFSGWNQKMLDLIVDGKWVFALFGFLIGIFLAAYSIIIGIRTAKSFKLLLERLNKGSKGSNWKVDTWNRHVVVMVVLLLMLGVLLSVSGTLLRKEFNSEHGSAQLWLACLVAAPGVWIRWFLARLNGRGLGKAGLLEWVPFGTLIANVSAACVMAALATLKKAVPTTTCITVSTGIQLGFLGCLSTVSTFMAEYNAMEESHESWRAYAYALLTIVLSFGLGIPIYLVPVWTEGYNK